MRKPFATERPSLLAAPRLTVVACTLSLCAGWLFAGPVLAAGPTAQTLDFDRTFGGADGRQTFYAATYRLDGQPHRVEVWRDHEARVKRRTDDAVETYATRPAGSDEWRMTVLDLRRRMRTDVARTNLMRIGHFTDWFAQTRSLSRPRGAYRLTAMKEGPAGVRPIAACRWYLLAQAGRSTAICWSAAHRVPLDIVDAGGATVWQVTQLGSGPFPAKTFAIDDAGFARNDADREIEAD